MHKNFVLLLICVCAFLTLPSCGTTSSPGFDPTSAPTLEVTLQSSYTTDSSGSAEEWSNAVTNFQGRQSAFNSLGSTLENSSTEPSEALSWDTDEIYALPGNAIKHLCGNRS